MCDRRSGPSTAGAGAHIVAYGYGFRMIDIVVGSYRRVCRVGGSIGHRGERGRSSILIFPLLDARKVPSLRRVIRVLSLFRDAASWDGKSCGCTQLSHVLAAPSAKI